MIDKIQTDLPQTNDVLPINEHQSIQSPEVPISVSPVENTPLDIPPTPKTKSKLVPVLLIILILVLLGVGGVYAYKNFFVKAPEPTPTPEATLDPTADWKTFTESSLGLSFKYPSTWSVTKSSASNLNIVITPDPKDEKGFVPMQITLEEANQYNGNVKFTTIQKAQEYYLKSLQSGADVIASMKVGDKVASRISGIAAGPGPGEGNFLQYTFIELNNKVLTVQLGRNDIQNVHDQILSTFKFTDDNIPQITGSELDRGWYWGNEDQKKPGTPESWVYTEAGRSSCWHKPNVNCSI